MLNHERANYGLAALKAGTPDYLDAHQTTNVVDTLANIMHYCQRNGIDFERAAEDALRHQVAEFDEENRAFARDARP